MNTNNFFSDSLFNLLPNELLAKIFGRLPGKAISNCSEVSKLWCMIASLDKVWKKSIANTVSPYLALPCYYTNKYKGYLTAKNILEGKVKMLPGLKQHSWCPMRYTQRSPDQKLQLSICDNGWMLEEMRYPNVYSELFQGDTHLCSVGFTFDSQKIMTFDEKKLCLFDRRSAKKIAEMAHSFTHSSHCLGSGSNPSCFSSNSLLFATARGKDVILWKMDEKKISLLEAPLSSLSSVNENDLIKTINFFPDNTTLLSTTLEKLHIWNCSDGKHFSCWSPPDQYTLTGRVCAISTQNFIASMVKTIDNIYQIMLWNIKGDSISTIAINVECIELEFLNDAQMIATVCLNKLGDYYKDYIFNFLPQKSWIKTKK